MSLIGNTALAALLTFPAFAQAPALPRFEEASIRPSAVVSQGHVNTGLRIDGARVRGFSLSLKDYLGIAYRIEAARISGPEWITSELFDLSATIPAGGTSAQVPEMLRALLADRFQVKLHKEKKDFPVYALLSAKGPAKLPAKLKEAPDSNAGKNEPKATVNIAGAGSNPGRGSSYSFANNRFEAQRLTMTEFAGDIERFADRPVIDLTGLAGRYDFALNLTPEDYHAMLIRAAISAGASLPPEARRELDGSSGDALPNALRQIGLKLEAREMPLDVLVIDGALKTPAGD